MVKIRGNHNIIDMISFDGKTLVDQNSIKETAVAFFSSSFQVSPVSIVEDLFDCPHPTVSLHHNQSLITMPDASEIERAVFSLGRHSFPGVDGIFGVFFTSCWPIIGPLVVAAIQNFFSSGKLLKACSSFLIALIPKKPNPASFQDYRSISLLNFIYKIITKVMVSHLAPILPHLISWHQAAFIKERLIYDHIALAHELTQRLKLKMSGGSVCMKLDISKDFDMLD